MIEALAAGGVDAVARGEVGNLDAARTQGGAFAVTAHDSRVEVGGFALAAADAELAACLDRHIAWLTDNGRIGYRSGWTPPRSSCGAPGNGPARSEAQRLRVETPARANPRRGMGPAQGRGESQVRADGPAR